MKISKYSFRHYCVRTGWGPRSRNPPVFLKDGLKMNLAHKFLPPPPPSSGDNLNRRLPSGSRGATERSTFDSALPFISAIEKEYPWCIYRILRIFINFVFVSWKIIRRGCYWPPMATTSHKTLLTIWPSAVAGSFLPRLDLLFAGRNKREKNGSRRFRFFFFLVGFLSLIINNHNNNLTGVEPESEKV